MSSPIHCKRLPQYQQRPHPLGGEMNTNALIENAATCSQCKTLVDDEVVRECIELNIIQPLTARVAELEAALRKITMTAHDQYDDNATHETLAEIARAALKGAA